MTIQFLWTRELLCCWYFRSQWKSSETNIACVILRLLHRWNINVILCFIYFMNSDIASITRSKLDKTDILWKIWMSKSGSSSRLWCNILQHQTYSLHSFRIWNICSRECSSIFARRNKSTKRTIRIGHSRIW